MVVNRFLQIILKERSSKTKRALLVIEIVQTYSRTFRLYRRYHSNLEKDCYSILDKKCEKIAKWRRVANGRFLCTTPRATRRLSYCISSISKGNCQNMGKYLFTTIVFTLLFSKKLFSKFRIKMV